MLRPTIAMFVLLALLGCASQADLDTARAQLKQANERIAEMQKVGSSLVADLTSRRLINGDQILDLQVADPELWKRLGERTNLYTDLPPPLVAAPPAGTVAPLHMTTCNGFGSSVTCMGF